MFERFMGETLTAMKTQGVFVVTGNNPPNVMYLPSGSLGYFWNKPVFVVPVRYSRYTYDLIDRDHVFAISVPRKDLSNALTECAHMSGRDTNKFEVLSLHPRPARHINTVIVSDCSLHYECRVLYKAGMEAFQLPEGIRDEHYKEKDFHTFFFGEILDVYET